ncbi:MAG: hypothetical protein WCC59_04115 [Terriglobales bacterium]
MQQQRGHGDGQAQRGSQRVQQAVGAMAVLPQLEKKKLVVGAEFRAHARDTVDHKVV